MTSLEQECIEYFKSTEIWQQIFEGFRKKYASYGSFSGSVTVRLQTMQDAYALEGFFGQSYHGKKSASISAKHFAKALSDSRFGSMEATHVLECYFGESLISKKEAQEQRLARKEAVLSELSDCYRGTPAWDVITQLATLVPLAEADFDAWRVRLALALEIWNNLPYRNDQYIYRPVFAAMLTGDPHAFDDKTENGQLLLAVAKENLDARGMQLENEPLFPAITKQRLFEACGILVDNVSNNAMICGIRAEK
ncbi:MAG: TIGR02679 domain-containing protein, partial [Peptococcaceae bacterium]|nr:TIGR02679 domain-containing protein [Peptococcaceae bacterium]